jgi:excisionase family DNA binding protein
VAILQERQGLTTVQASRLLGVSRQFLVNLIDSGEIMHHMVGTHRRVYLKDLMEYKQRRDNARRAVLNQMVQSELEAGVYGVVPDDFTGQ